MISRNKGFRVKQPGNSLRALNRYNTCVIQNVVTVGMPVLHNNLKMP